MSKVYQRGTGDEMIQITLALEGDPAAVLTVRPDGSIEARWPALDLCAVRADWAGMLAYLPDVCRFLGVPFRLRVRRAQ